MNIKKEFLCSCGKKHAVSIDDVIIENNAILKLPEIIRRYTDGKVFIIADKNTFNAAGEKVIEALFDKNIEYSKFVFESNVTPDEHSVGAAIMHFDTKCEIVVAIGSGVINDIGKIVANVTDKPYIIVATAPSMDGYASATSSMEMSGLKVSLNSKCANVIIGDIDILKNAPLKMLKAGLGDMIAKYISICEWRIANLLIDEYYCEEVANLVRSALQKCVDNAEKLLERDDEAVKAVFEGLVIGGVAMAYVGVSRPASGVEHYFSHLWDMRGLEFKTPVDLHGIQCGIGTYLASGIYEQLREITPDIEKARNYVKKFDNEKWNSELRAFIGKGAEAMIALEEKDQKYSISKHETRIKKIISEWDNILKIIEEEVPTQEYIGNLLDKIDAPKLPEEINIKDDILLSFKATKDIRDKYVLSRLFWDLGIIEDVKI